MNAFALLAFAFLCRGPDGEPLVQVPTGRLTTYAVFTARMTSPQRLAVRVPSFSYIKRSYEEKQGDQALVRTYYQPVRKDTTREYRVGEFEVFRADGRLVPAMSLANVLNEETRVVIATGHGIHPADYALFKRDTLILVFPTPESTPVAQVDATIGQPPSIVPTPVETTPGETPQK